MVPVAKKMKASDLVSCFNIILLYVEITVVKGLYFYKKSDPLLKKLMDKSTTLAVVFSFIFLVCFFSGETFVGYYVPI
jgi:hypothetical protein